MERADGDEHDCVHECGENVLGDDKQQETACCATGGEDRYHELCKARRDQAADEGPAPDVHGRVGLAPFADVIAQEDFNGEVDKDNQGELFLLEALVKQFQAGDCIVGLEANLCDQVDDDEGLNVLQLQNTPHGLVYLLYAVGAAIAVLALHERKAKGYEKVRPAPECEISVKFEETGFGRCVGGAEPFVCEVFRVEGEEYSVRKELASCEADGLGGRGVCEVLFGKECKGPAWSN